jgi:hypothetical protein
MATGCRFTTCCTANRVELTCMKCSRNVILLAHSLVGVSNSIVRPYPVPVGGILTVIAYHMKMAELRMGTVFSLFNVARRKSSWKCREVETAR